MWVSSTRPDWLIASVTQSLVTPKLQLPTSPNTGTIRYVQQTQSSNLKNVMFSFSKFSVAIISPFVGPAGYVIYRNDTATGCIILLLLLLLLLNIPVSMTTCHHPLTLLANKKDREQNMPQLS